MDVGVDHHFGGAPAGRRDQPAVSEITLHARPTREGNRQMAVSDGGTVVYFLGRREGDRIGTAHGG